MPASEKVDIPTLKAQYKHLSSTPKVIDTDVFIAGSGPVGATFARTIIDGTTSAKVFMSEVGSHSSPRYGWHHKNEIGYQKDMDKFVNVIQGALSTLSIPPVDTQQPLLEPTPSWVTTFQDQLIMDNHNPSQDPFTNLSGAAVTRTVGGMATHWTCATPTPHAEELPNTYSSSEWDALYRRGKVLLKTNTDTYNESIRHTIVKDTLNNAYKDDKTRVFENLPLAVERRTDNPDYVTWTGTDTILGDLALPGNNPRFTLQAETRTTALVLDANRTRVMAAIVRDLATDQDFVVYAQVFVAACGAVLTPQLLYNSGIRPYALGRYLTEHTIAFCQITLKRDIVEGVETDPRFAEKVAHHHAVAPKDPLPIPFADPEPQVTQPYTPLRPWHTQIHRDAFSYGGIGPTIDPRLVVDLRWFAKVETSAENRVEFPVDIGPFGDNTGGSNLDQYGMPQPTFVFRFSEKDKKRNQDMMNDMCAVANHLGGFIPGSNPQFMAQGLCQHIMGTIRVGEDKGTSVIDKDCKVHDLHNLFLGGNGVIPEAISCNPTLTSVCYALHAADTIIALLGEK